MDAVLQQISAAIFRLRRISYAPLGAGSDAHRLADLAVVLTVGELPGEVTVGTVAERLCVEPSTASRLVGHAVEAGLVARFASTADARRADLRLTPAGERVREIVLQRRMDYMSVLLEDWTEEERATFAGLLTRFSVAAARHPRRPDGIRRIFAEAARESAEDS